jgi:hypothetical protein
MFNQLACLGGVVKLDTPQQLTRSARSEHLVEATPEMDVAIVTHQVDATCRTIDPLHQVAGKHHECFFGALGSDCHRAASRLGFYRYEQIAGVGTHIFLVLPGWLAGLHGDRGTAMRKQLRALFIETHRRLFSLVRT